MASVQSSLVMHPINEFGSDAQKEKYLPRLGKYSANMSNDSLTEPSSQGRANRMLCTSNPSKVLGTNALFVGFD